MMTSAGKQSDGSILLKNTQFMVTMYAPNKQGLVTAREYAPSK